jgi:hypothetical protein
MLDPHAVWSNNMNTSILNRLQALHGLLLGLHSALLQPILPRRTKASMGVGSHMDWKQLLAYITGSADQELLLRIEYLVTENRILRNQIQGCVRLSDGERKTLATIGKQLIKQALAEVTTIVTPDTILA